MEQAKGKMPRAAAEAKVGVDTPAVVVAGRAAAAEIEGSADDEEAGG